MSPYKFGARSLKVLGTVDPKLRQLFEKVIQYRDCSAIWGFRNEEDQETAFRTGHSKKRWPESSHNTYPSRAIDVVPYPTLYQGEKELYELAGWVQAYAKVLNISIRWGGDWDGDGDLKDQNFYDLAHYELVNKGAE